jgi:hypothetical protein
MRNVVIPDIIKISAVFFALQMLILSAAELQIWQDETCRLCKPAQSWSFAFTCDAGWSLRRAGGGLYMRRRIQPAPSEGQTRDFAGEPLFLQKSSYFLKIIIS